MVAYWPKVAPTSALTSGVTQVDQFPAERVEALLTYVFQQLGLSLNTVLVSPTNITSMPQQTSVTTPNPNALQPSRQFGKGKPCIVNGQKFYSVMDYATWSQQERNITVNRTRVRQNLTIGTKNNDPNNRYLTQAEAEKALQNNEFVDYKRNISIS